ncbi:hypothetical protein ACRXCV_12775 [Halobacteriovorax sp. GFR7]|uniref:hypothetical protein n=1 Tax=unclassified Halobacteriovorax TaxID=2639665 RepID=UPI003D99CCAE
MKLKNTKNHIISMMYALFLCLILGQQSTYSAATNTSIEDDIYASNQDNERFEFKVLVNETGSNFGIDLSEQDLDELAESVGNFKISTLSFSKNRFNRDGAVEWYHNIRNVSKVFYNVITDHKRYNEHTAVRASINLAHQVVSWWISRTNYTLVHEVAHAQAVKEFGGSEIQLWVGDEAYQSVGAFYLAFMSTYNRGAVSYSIDRPSAQQEAVISAAGINSQISLAEDIAEESIVNRRFDQSDALHYILNKVISTIYYQYDPNSNMSDLAHYAQALHQQGLIEEDEIDSTKEFISNISFLATLLSGRTWEAVNAISDEIILNKNYTETYRFETPLGEITWPEFAAFLNEKGVSGKISTSLLTQSRMTYHFSFETSLLGESANELGIGFTYKADEWQTSVKTYFNDQDGRGISIKSKYEVGKDSGFSFFAEAKADNGTLSQRRHQYSLTGQENNEFETSFSIGVEYRF